MADQTTTLIATLNNDDLEEDGLFDDEEENRFPGGFGNRHTTDPFEIDTDDDGHSDYDPLVYEERYGPLEIGREFFLGAVLGEWGADDHDNIFYLGGWIASGVVVLGDVRDIAATISRGGTPPLSRDFWYDLLCYFISSGCDRVVITGKSL